MSSERNRRRILAVIAILVAAGVLAFLAFGGIGENLVYYWSPSELEASGDKALGATIRLGGLVEPGSIQHSEDGLTLKFAVTDGEASIPISTKSVPPAMFREGVGVVVEGSVNRAGQFETQRLLVKHDNQYQAPGEGESLDRAEMMKSMQFEMDTKAREKESVE
ncbi:MAG: cytochrome c maturation protein CcmE [Thermoanaerobaculia bacterium]